MYFKKDWHILNIFHFFRRIMMRSFYLLLAIMLSGMYIPVSSENIISGFQKGTATNNNIGFFSRDPLFDSTWRSRPGTCDYSCKGVEYPVQMPNNFWPGDVNLSAVAFDSANIYFGFANTGGACISIYNRNSKQTRVYGKIPTDFSYDLLVHKKSKRLFVGTTGGLSYANITADGSGMSFKTIVPSGSSKTIHAIASYGDTVWGMNSRNVFRIVGEDITSWADTAADFNDDGFKIAGFTGAMAVDKDGSCWVVAGKDSAGCPKNVAGLFYRYTTSDGKWKPVSVAGFSSEWGGVSVIDGKNVLWIQTQSGLGKIDLNKEPLSIQVMTLNELGYSYKTDFYMDVGPAGGVMIGTPSYTWEDTAGLGAYYKSIAAPVIKGRYVPIIVRGESQFVGIFSLNGRKLSTANSIAPSSGISLYVQASKERQNIVTKSLGFSANPNRGLNGNR